MKRKQGSSRYDDGNSEGDGDEYAKKVRAGPDICDDVLLSIFSRLTSRDAARCAALSKHHRHRICGMDFWLLHRSLSPPLPCPHIAYMSTIGASSDPTNVRRRPAAAPLPDRVFPRCMFIDFHLAGGHHPGDDNDDLRYSLIDRVHLHQRYVGTCDGVILMAPERFNGGASILLFNPAVAGSEVEVRMELPFLFGHGRYRVLGFGYGPSRRAHKLLLVRDEPTPRPAISYHAKELLVYTLGVIPSATANQKRHRSVLSELDDAKISGHSVYLDGKIYLLADHSRVLAFDLDDESVTTIGLPTAGGKHAASKHSKLVEVSGRLCVAAGDSGELALWLLAADWQWVRLCEFQCGGGPGTAGKLAGAWDCGGVLLLYFKHRVMKTAYLHLYDTRTDKALQKVTVPRTVAAEQDGSGLVVCWGYRPTLVSPESIVGAPPSKRGAGGGVRGGAGGFPRLGPLIKALTHPKAHIPIDTIATASTSA